MRTRTLLTSLALMAMLPLSSCGVFGSTEPPAPSQPGSIASDGGAETPTAGSGAPTGTLPEVSLDMSAVTALEAPEGAQADQFTRAQATVEGYTLGMFNPTFLSGGWKDQSADERWGTFRDVTGEELYEDMKELDPDDSEDTNTIFSLAAVFTPTDTVKAPASCTPDALPLAGCLTEDITTSEGTAAIEGATGMYVFTYKVSTTRGVDIQGEAGQVSLSYDAKLWVDPESGRVVSVNNSYDFSEASKVS